MRKYVPSIKGIRSKVYSDLYEALDDVESRSLKDVAGRIGSTEQAVYIRLHRLYVMNEVARDVYQYDPQQGRPIFYYRRLPENVKGVPLYDRQKGWDTLALSTCLGGLGYNVCSNQARMTCHQSTK